MAVLLVLVTPCFLRGRGFARGVTSSLDTSSVTALRFLLAMLSECLTMKTQRVL